MEEIVWRVSFLIFTASRRCHLCRLPSRLPRHLPRLHCLRLCPRALSLYRLACRPHPSTSIREYRQRLITAAAGRRSRNRFIVLEHLWPTIIVCPHKYQARVPLPLCVEGRSNPPQKPNEYFRIQPEGGILPTHSRRNVRSFVALQVVTYCIWVASKLALLALARQYRPPTIGAHRVSKNVCASRGRAAY